MSSPQILSFGEILWDVIEGDEYIGGAPFNAAAHLAQLGCESYFVSRVGDDSRGQRALKQAEELGVNIDLIQKDPTHPTGWVDVEFDQKNAPQYIIHTGVSYDFIDLDDGLLDFISQKKLAAFYFGTLAQRKEVSRDTLNKIIKEVQAQINFFDINLRQEFFSRDIIAKSLEFTDILKLNEGEYRRVPEILYNRRLKGPQIASRLQTDFDLEIICVTRGAKGCTVITEEEKQDLPGSRVEVVDTVGSGDAFSAGFLFYFLQQGDPFKAADLGNYLGGFTAAHRSAVPKYKKSDILQDFK